MNIVQILDERWDSALTEYGLTLAAALKARGHAVFVCARIGRHAQASAAQRGLSVHPLDSPLGFRRFLRRHGVQVVNCHTGTGHLWGWWGAAGRDIALVRTRADARPLARRWGHARLYARTDAAIGVSRVISSQYQAVFPELAGRLWTVYPGLPLPAFSPEPAGPARVALVGRLDPVKGQTYFLEAVNAVRAHLRDEEFLIVGEEANTPLGELKRYAEKSHVARWVRFLGRQEDVGAFMRSCHVGVVASVGSEALSRVCLEWMAQGRPVVASAVGCLPELVSTGDNGFLVPPRSPRAMGNCLLGLLQQPEYRREMGRRSHALASARFSLDRFAVDTEKVYEEALRRRLTVRRAG